MFLSLSSQTMLMILCKHGCDEDNGKNANYDCDDTVLINSTGALPPRQSYKRIRAEELHGVRISKWKLENLVTIITTLLSRW